jgi:hypothetical protein
MTAIRSLILAAALTAAAAGSAFAQEATPDTWQQTASTLSRADVAAELAAARASGLTRAWSAGYIEPLRSQALRSEVQARTLQAIERGELKAINAEVYGAVPVAPQRVSLATR